jgi:hypothetical protein
LNSGSSHKRDQSMSIELQDFLPPHCLLRYYLEILAWEGDIMELHSLCNFPFILLTSNGDPQFIIHMVTQITCSLLLSKSEQDSSQ